MTPAELRKARKRLGEDLVSRLVEARELLVRHGYRVVPPDIEKIEARFWSKVDRASGECWLWTAGKDRKGYGVFRVRGRAQGAHRFAWEFANETFVPPGLVVMHSCDTPSCVNPAHLSIGTNAENTADKVAKGRHARGEITINSAKLTPDDVRAIRSSAVTARGLARHFGVSEANIRMIRARRTWRHVA